MTTRFVRHVSGQGTQWALVAIGVLALSGCANSPPVTRPVVTIHEEMGEAAPWQFTHTGALKIDRQSFEAMLAEYPEAKLRVILVPCEEAP